MLNAKTISQKLDEYRSLLWLRKRYDENTSYTNPQSQADLIPAVFHQSGSSGARSTGSRQIITDAIRNTAVITINQQIAVLEGEFERMNISLEDITD